MGINKTWAGQGLAWRRQAYFGQAKAACLCSYFCNRHLCYDGGRSGRVKIVTLRVGVRAKEGKRGGGGEKKIPLPPNPLLLTRPIFSSLFEFQHLLSRAKHLCAGRKRQHCKLARVPALAHSPPIGHPVCYLWPTPWAIHIYFNNSPGYACTLSAPRPLQHVTTGAFLS